MHGYYQYPTLHDQQIVFVCEDDLWWVERSGGLAQRLTASPGRCNHPTFSPDGKKLAYTGRDEGYPEVYLLDLESGHFERLTFLGADTRTVGFSRDGRWIYFATNSAQPFARLYVLGRVPVGGGPAELMPWGPANWISFAPEKGRILGRHTGDSARWKRYRGGTAGQFWVDASENDRWKSLKPGGNLTRPLWVGERIYFGSDQDDHGHLYSCLPNGKDLRQHTDHSDYYLRHPSSDGRDLVYQCGAEVYLFDVQQQRSQQLSIRLRAGGFQRQRKFRSGGHYLHSYDLHPKGQALACTVRGKALAFYPHERPVHLLGKQQGVRYRLASWLHGGERIVVVSDEGDREHLEIYPWNGGEPQVVACSEDLGRPLELAPAPSGPWLGLTNHRYELWLVNLETAQARRLEANPHGRLSGLCWSPCGHYLVYSSPTGRLTSKLRCSDVREANSEPLHDLTEGCYRDVAPSFDPQGRHLYFLSLRTFNPVWDNLFFELSFPNGMKPYALVLRDDLPHPFEFDPVPKPEPPKSEKSKKKEEKPKVEPTRIDFEGLHQRIVAFPLSEGRYGQVIGCGDTILYSRYPVEGTLEEDHSAVPSARGTLYSYDLKTQESKELYTRVSGFTTSADGKWLCYQSGTKLRIATLEKKPESQDESNPRKSGWIAPARLRVAVESQSEWMQMAREAWRLMREHYFNPQLPHPDWDGIFRRYEPLLARVGSRSELSDWLWELQGELGTSHAYESGGDYNAEPVHPLGKLGLTWHWDKKARGYRIDSVAQGDSWDPQARSAALLGQRLQVGDVVTHIQARPLSPQRAPEAELVYVSREDIEFTVVRQGEVRRLTVRPLRAQAPLMYREWVEANRRRVHEASQGRLGYLHVPNMGPLGFSEFHRGFFSEVARDGLIVDVRYNGGGNVSGLLLEKLSRRIVGWDVPRYGQPISYPMEAPQGPLVALTNEMAGSDGDIFSHCFKLLQLGTLVGTRTWGGVIGIWPRHRLVDGTQTTQPEFAFWFEDVGWRVENYGTDPDINIEIAPHDWKKGRDPQLDKALELALQALEQSPPRRPPTA